MVDIGRSAYRACDLCPHRCGVDRTRGVRGRCGELDRPRMAYAGLHLGEEPVIAGARGSGTVFFSGCTLRCASCQNHQISHHGMGREIGVEELSSVFVRLEEEGAPNINVVTGTHFIPDILSGIDCAHRRGLTVPVVWNSSGFEREDIVERLAEEIKVFLLDLKTLDHDLAAAVFGTARYPELAVSALRRAVELRELAYDGDLLTSGVIVRHLHIPGHTESTREVLEWFAREVGGAALLSLMFQYTPSPEAPGRGTSRREYDQVMGWLSELDIDEGFVQELVHDREWLPDFSQPDPFPSRLSRPLWTWLG